MMIKGIGIDIVDVDEFKKVKDIARIFTEGELAYCSMKNEESLHLAARFAVKEAVYKSLSISDGNYPNWKEIETIRTEARITVELKGDIAHKAADINVKSIEVSISHSKSTAVAIAIALG